MENSIENLNNCDKQGWLFFSYIFSIIFQPFSLGFDRENSSTRAKIKKSQEF